MGDLDASTEVSLEDLTPEARRIIGGILTQQDDAIQRVKDRYLFDNTPCPDRAVDAALGAWTEAARKELGLTRAASVRHLHAQLRLYRTNKPLMAAITEAYREGLCDGTMGRHEKEASGEDG